MSLSCHLVGRHHLAEPIGDERETAAPAWFPETNVVPIRLNPHEREPNQTMRLEMAPWQKAAGLTAGKIAADWRQARWNQIRTLGPRQMSGLQKTWRYSGKSQDELGTNGTFSEYSARVVGLGKEART